MYRESGLLRRLGAIRQAMTVVGDFTTAWAQRSRPTASEIGRRRGDDGGDGDGDCKGEPILRSWFPATLAGPCRVRAIQTWSEVDR
jgi:hypothetical protein